MKPLTPDDLLPLPEYSSRRREFFESLQRYVDRYRRVRVGPRLTLVFENRQTLWFRVQEVIRVARLTEPERLREELALYNRLLPGPMCLQAALLIEVRDEARLQEELAPWAGLLGEHLVLHAAAARVPAQLLTARPEDRCAGAAHWVQFHLGAAERDALADPTRSALFEVTMPAYPHRSPPLSDEVRQSLLDDLSLSDRDAA
jgi:hypothetical protein